MEMKDFNKQVSEYIWRNRYRMSDECKCKTCANYEDVSDRIVKLALSDSYSRITNKKLETDDIRRIIEAMAHNWNVVLKKVRD